MDVGCWGGSAPDDQNAHGHWRKQRYFGIVYERLSVLCAYKPWMYSGNAPKLDEAKTVPSDLDFKKNDQCQKLLPLLKALSTDLHLGPVVVLQAVLNNQPGMQAPPDDRIHVILGDLHAPVMTARDSTYAGRTHVQPARSPAGRGTAPSRSTQAPPGVGRVSGGTGLVGQSRATSIDPGLGLGNAVKILAADPGTSDWRTSIDPGIGGSNAKKLSSAEPGRDERHISIETGVWDGRYPLKGRYDRGVVAPALIPLLSRLLGKGAKVIAQGDTVLVKLGAAEALASPAAIALPAAILFGGTAAALGDITAATVLDRWSDDDAVELPVVEDWFDRYHGKGKTAGADVFDSAGKDLEAWLKMIKTYQGSADPEDLPVKLIQVGDLFDFWIGLKCPFSLVGGARDFPNEDAARKFVEYWLAESLRNEHINFLWTFDTIAPYPSKGMETVFLHGNHDTCMGSRLVANSLPAQFVDKGLIVEHGHKDDPFNKDGSAGLGYLLTQAVFIDNYVRSLEDTMAAAKTKLLGGLWTRLGYNETALKACVAERMASGATLASTFVMGHTHEPVLQRIDIVQEYDDPSRRRSKSTGFPEPPEGGVVKQEGADSSPNRSTSLPEAPEVGVQKEGGDTGTSSNRSTSVRTRASLSEIPIPRALQCGPRWTGPAQVTITFREVQIPRDHIVVPYNMIASVRTISANTAKAVVTTLLDECCFRKGEKPALAGQPLEARATVDDQVEIVVQGWQGQIRPQYTDPWAFMTAMAKGELQQVPQGSPAHNLDLSTIRVRVHPNTWKGTRELACESFVLWLEVKWDCATA
jgi:hypothetical protein